MTQRYVAQRVRNLCLRIKTYGELEHFSKNGPFGKGLWMTDQVERAAICREAVELVLVTLKITADEYGHDVYTLNEDGKKLCEDPYHLPRFLAIVRKEKGLD